MIAYFVLLILLSIAFVTLDMSLRTWLIVGAVAMLFGFLSGATSWWLSLLTLVIFAALAAFLYFLPDARRRLISAPAFERMRELMPPISPTEQAAIDAGTTWWEGELFSGKPRWERLMSLPKPRLSQEEREFVEGPVEELCALSDDWDISHRRGDLSPATWHYIREQGFFGINASPEYGGLGFSPFAQSCIVQKLASRSATTAVTVMVPNSLGPAELLFHYGTQEQKAHYLPRLASGAEIPCFALTGPWAGSDAAGMPDTGIVCRGTHEGEDVLGFRVNWDKRYITLGPVATLIGLAFRTRDPDGLLGEEEDLGITCVLIPADTPGISIGNRHLPLNAAFQNGPNQGKDVFVPLDWVIGGREQVGQGWRMLMESLAAGRGISLPAAAAGTAKLATRASGAYARVREQFGIEIGRFEGIGECLARIGGLTYLLDAGRVVMAGALGEGEKPAVLSAIVKQQCTDLSRMVLNDAMDLHGGKAICTGPSNTLASAYQQIPIGITVEGANILTRSLIIFGQGALRCHPFLLDEMRAVSDPDREAGLEAFDEALRGHVGHVLESKMRAFVLGLSRGWLGKGFGAGAVRRYSGQVEHLSASFAWLADLALVSLGGDLKRREMLSGRFADALSNLYLASAALKRFCDNGEDPAEQPLLDWSCQYALHQAQEALDGILRNFPVRYLGPLLRIAVFPTGRYLRYPGDELSRRVARLLQTPGEIRDRLTEDIYTSDDPAEPTAQLESALALAIESTDLRKRLKKAGHDAGGVLGWEAWLAERIADGDVNEREADLLRRWRSAVAAVIAVDDFAPESVACQDREYETDDDD